MFLILYIVAYFVKHRLVWKEIRRCNSFSSKTFAFPSFRNKVVCRSTQKNQIYAFVQERNITSPSQKQLLFYCFVSCKLIRNCYKICAFTLTVRAPTGGGQCPGAALFGGGHFWWKEGIANGLSRMNLKLDLGFTFWLRLDLPYVWPGPSRFKRLSRLANYPGISLQWNFQK